MMSCNLKEYRGDMKKKRNYDDEHQDTASSKYVYNFDRDIMHGFMVRSFSPFFTKGKVLELGSFQGDFTKRLIPFFKDITCIEASKNAVLTAKKRLGNKVRLVHALFEEAILPSVYDNIILTHVLEHLDNRVALLKKINNEWLSEKGRVFIACPNAQAPSRQIAVNMGLIKSVTSVTPEELLHGHRITYTLQTLERDAVRAGLKVIHRSGIFFKPFANFQWDKLLKTDIISKEYLEGCFVLGQKYPELCSSVFLVCEKGKKAGIRNRTHG
jgi:2-polyprenyl-3-methyl-5-hydroxy-6-metoxy-1,4-benzoquinol methylase